MSKYFMHFVCLLLIATTSCGTSRKLKKAIPQDTNVATDAQKQDEMVDPDDADFAQHVYKKLQENRIDFNSFSAKIKMELNTSGSKKNDLNASVRIKKDSAIWITVNAMLGIEALRMLITTDSVKIIDKINKTYRIEPLAFFQNFINYPIDYQTIEDLIIGNPVILGSNRQHAANRNMTISKNQNDLILLSILDEWTSNDFTISADYYLTQTNHLKDLDTSLNRSFMLNYYNYVKKNNKYFPAIRDVKLSGSTWFELHMDYKQFSFNEPLTFPFTIPKNYQEHKIQ